MISDLLFSKQLSFSFKILSFSSKHKLHLLDPPVWIPLEDSSWMKQAVVVSF